LIAGRGERRGGAHPATSSIVLDGDPQPELVGAVE
jgi:hypothetical protein